MNIINPFSTFSKVRRKNIKINRIIKIRNPKKKRSSAVSPYRVKILPKRKITSKLSSGTYSFGF